MVHKSLLCHFSFYYQAAINGAFVEANRATYTIKTTPAALELLIGWLYARNLRKADGTRCKTTLTQLWVIADMTNMIALARDIINVFCKPTQSPEEKLPGYDLTTNLFKSITEVSPLWKWLVELHVRHWDPANDTDDGEQGALRRVRDAIPSDFYIAVIAGKHDLVWGGGRHQPCKCCSESCEFHGHESEEERLASKFGQIYIVHRNLAYKNQLAEQRRRRRGRSPRQQRYCLSKVIGFWKSWHCAQLEGATFCHESLGTEPLQDMMWIWRRRRLVQFSEMTLCTVSCKTYILYIRFTAINYLFLFVLPLCFE